MKLEELKIYRDRILAIAERYYAFKIDWRLQSVLSDRFVNN